ncbi:uncharacterized protein LOC130647685 [Hydractinia symbiolongicarpus]|uniref:uncharacterized protein LOC130647685 n=1 Tax=Hydractinia symbiolongicarpus TaxID=13093 RepID=UPI00254DC285|nr:uncharacterized protein LOC130647685 [Hydractinia symbiolongicarpus]
MYTLSDFVIGSSIGEGRFARVHEASLQKRPVALRVIKLNEAAAISNKKLIAQAKALCSVEHKNIVKCFGALVGETKGFVLELCGKKIYDMFEEVTVRSLHGLLQILEDDISLEWRLKALLDVSDGLNYLHDKSIVAGDVKPSNVLICGEVENDITFKIADYSVQSILQQQTSLMMSSYGAGKLKLTQSFTWHLKC